MLMLMLTPLALAGAPALDCPEGQSQLHKKATACCWEGQSWDKKGGLCVGEPTCPEGLVVRLNEQGFPTCGPVPEIAEGAGILGALHDSGALEQWDSGGLDSDLMGGIGGLIGASGTEIGAGGLSVRTPPAQREGNIVGAETLDMGTDPTKMGLVVARDIIILGALDKALVDEGVAKAMDELEACVQPLLATGDGGKVVIKFVVDKEGAVSSSSVKTSTLQDTEAPACMAKAIGSLSFPAPKGGGIAIISYPFLVIPER